MKMDYFHDEEIFNDITLRNLFYGKTKEVSPELVNRRDSLGRNSLFYPKDIESFKTLIDSKIDINVKDVNGRNVLFYERDLDKIVLLLENGIEIDYDVIYSFNKLQILLKYGFDKSKVNSYGLRPVEFYKSYSYFLLHPRDIKQIKDCVKLLDP